MAQSERFGLSVHVLAVLALEPEAMHTSVSIAARLGTNPVAVRRLFGTLAAAGFLVQKKGPAGGVRLKGSAKSIGVGDVYSATSSEWPLREKDAREKSLEEALAHARGEAIQAMNATSIASLAKRMKKHATGAV
jgi:DNA-binding IscR family transcriptional regulator